MKTMMRYVALFGFLNVFNFAFADAPNWQVDPSGYQFSMSLVGVILFEDVESVDANDIIAAFVGEECRGIAKPTFFPVTGRYTFGMTIYSNSSSGETITFKAYDASEDLIYDSIDETYPFQSDAIIGDDMNPQVLHAYSAFVLRMAADPADGGTTEPSLGDTTVARNEVIPIRAIPSEGYRFVEWTGTDIANPSSVNTMVTVDEDKTITANFQKTYDLTVAINPQGGGTITPGAGIHTYDEGTTVPITATPAAGYRFLNWTGNVDDPNSASTNVTMDGNKTITANFQKTYDLTMLVSPQGGGTTSPAVGVHTYDEGTIVPITATPATGYRFVTWTGNVANPNSASSTVTMDGDKTVTAHFIAVYTLTMAADPAQGGTTDPGAGAHAYDDGTVVDITATPFEGYGFSLWTGDVANANSATTTVTIDGNKMVTAHFGELSTLTMAVNPEGSGTTIPSVGDTIVAKGSVISIKAKGGPGYAFLNWTGTGVANPNVPNTTVTMDGDKTVTANFVYQDTLTMAVDPITGGTTVPAAGDTMVAEGSIVTIEAVAALEYRFVNWTGEGIADPSSPNTTVTMDGKRTATAHFELIPYYTLTMAVQPVGGGSTVPAVGDTSVMEGTVVHIRAVAAGNYVFIGWTGTLIADETSPNTTVTVDEDKMVTANFKRQYTLTMAVDPPGSGTTKPAAGGTTVLDGDVIDIVATPEAGYSFSEWTGTGIADPKSASTTVNADGDKTVTAHFITHRPGWSVNPADFEYDMAITAVILFDDVESTNPNDWVGAFVDGECRGIASPVLFTHTGRYTLGMMVYSNTLNGEAVTFKAYDHSNDQVYDTVLETYPFQEDGILGDHFTPEALHAASMLTQEMKFGSGWNWFSLNVFNTDMTLNTVLSSLGDNAEFIKDQRAYAFYYAGYDIWYSSNGLDLINNPMMYMIKMVQEDTLRFTGYPVEYQNVPISLGVGWNWIGYLPQKPNNLNDALASIAGKGNFIKNQRAYAFYYAGYDLWYSSNGLDNMVPGEGYMLKMDAGATLTYGIPTGGLSKVLTVNHVPSDETGWIVDPYGYEHSMAITGVFEIDGKESVDENDVVGAFVGDECRGVSRLAYFPLNERFEFGMLVFGDEGEEITFKVYDAGSQAVCVSSQGIPFEVDGIVGDGLKPFMLAVQKESGEAMGDIPNEYGLSQNYPNPFNPTTTIQYQLPKDGRVALIIYNMMGQEVRRLVDEEKRAGYHKVVWDGKSEAGIHVGTGIYLIQIRAGSFSQTRKLLLVQ